MRIDPDRRRMMQVSLLTAFSGLMLGNAGIARAGDTASAAAGPAAPEHDFDFFLGTWQVRHRRLKKRLADSDDWEEFDGTTKCQSILGGIANMNDGVSYRPGGPYYGMGLRAYDAKTNRWADWYLDGRNPTKIDVPGVGRFENGVGTFFSDDTFESRPIKVRGVFTPITRDAAQWEQAFSPDGGKTWETNWVMRYSRIA